MRKYNLNIAGYNITFEAAATGPDIVPSSRFLRNLKCVTEPDLVITVHSGTMLMPAGAEMVFQAPFVEEVDGIPVQKKEKFWSIWKDQTGLFILTILPLSEPEKNALLKFSLKSRAWDLWIDSDDKQIDPFEYPVDGLVLYYLTVIHGDIMIHASGVNNAGHGYLFSGVSGKGKSTMAKLWDESGAKVIHDDRLILRNTGNGFRMYSTPVYRNDVPRESPLNKIFLIEHGSTNKLSLVKGATAVSLVMANCIQHNWGSEIIARLLGSVSIMCAAIPTVKLAFRPDRNVIDHILENE